MKNQLIKFSEGLPELHKPVLVICNGRKTAIFDTEGKQFVCKVVLDNITFKADSYICKAIRPNNHISYIPVFPDESWCYVDDVVNWNDFKEDTGSEEQNLSY